MRDHVKFPTLDSEIKMPSYSVILYQPSVEPSLGLPSYVYHYIGLPLAANMIFKQSLKRNEKKVIKYLKYFSLFC